MGRGGRNGRFRGDLSVCLYYHGGKKRAADWIVEKFPPAFYFLDVCGGGGSVSAAAAATGKFTHVVYNDVDTLLYDFLTTVATRPRALEAFIRAWPLGRYPLANIGDLIRADNRLHRAAGVFLSVNYNGHGIPAADSAVQYLRPRPPKNRHSTSKGGTHERNLLLRDLAAAAKRFREVTFEHLDGLVFYDRYFGKPAGDDTLTAPLRAAIFIDPPYGDTKHYENANFDLQKCLKIFSDKRAFVGVCYAPNDALGDLAAEILPFHGHLRGWNRTNTFTHALYLNFTLDAGPLFSGT